MKNPPMEAAAGVSISLEEIASALGPFCAGLSPSKLAAIRDYVDCLIVWNRTVNLTAVCDPKEMIRRHFGESLFAAAVVGGGARRLADVGSGAGFPGLPLRIFWPDLRVVLLEPNVKRAAFLAEIRRKLSLENVEIVRARFEESKIGMRSLDFVCARALGDYRRLLRWAWTALRQDGRILLWLGSEDANRIARFDGWYWDLPMKIPESQRRVVLCGRPAL